MSRYWLPFWWFGSGTQGGRSVSGLACSTVSAIFIVAAVLSHAEEVCGAETGPDFEREIRPILVEHCVACHGPKKQKNGLRLDARSLALRGGDAGPPIIAGKSRESELVHRITSDDPDVRMPPGKPLSPESISLLKRWIDSGALWPETDADRALARDSRREHWAWQPVKPATPPSLADPRAAGQYQNAIDCFLLARLDREKLSYSPPADRRTLIRRLTFDMWGLPPTPDEVRLFENDTQPLAYERLVDRVLASPHYGERAAQHWLDIAHYADTHGYERDQRRDNAWRYRDWVIDAFNADLAYPQFLRDQIAGDVLRPHDPAAIAATGFLAAGPWDFVGQSETPSPVLKRLARADDLDDMVAQVMTSTCGVTIHCARCHDHKLDPISQREYYGLWAIFAGLKRAERPLDAGAEKETAARRAELQAKLKELDSRVRRLKQRGYNLADLVGGGDGTGGGEVGAGIDPATGKAIKEKRGFLDRAPGNQFMKTGIAGIDGVVIPDGGKTGETTINSTGLVAHGVSATSGKAWDAIRNGPVNSQFSSVLGGIDFTKDGHYILALHANAAITFDLAELRKRGLPDDVRLRAAVGYFGQTPKAGANVYVFLDGRPLWERTGLGRDDGLIKVDLPLPAVARFLTLMSTDGGNDISHDQIGFGDIRLEGATSAAPSADAIATQERELAALTREREETQRALKALAEPGRVYAVVSEPPPPVQLLFRGDPEQPREAAPPSAIECLAGVRLEVKEDAATDRARRIAFTEWLTDARHPLVNRVIVNRLWQQHFGTGLVDTPSDFGLGGGRPSHPDLLDWLANELSKQGGSLKAMHRLICLSAAYRQQSLRTSARAAALDADNRMLWRQVSRRLDAESLRDAVLATSGSLHFAMHGPGYRDFEYKEEYAPVYTYVTPDRPELWRRSVYRFVVRTTPHAFMTTLDCPNPANLTPTRSITTTPLQALALLNHDFMLRQAQHFANRLAREVGPAPAAQVELAFQLAVARHPSESERAAAVKLVESHGLAAFCRYLLNANEFVTID